MFEKELLDAIEAAKLASLEIVKIYKNGFTVVNKSDNSPVTEADKSADNIIRTFLYKKYPSYAFLTEESEDNLNRLKKDFVWIVDPVDGTKEFVNHFPEFTTNIALCYKHEIVVGVVLVPITGEIYYATKDGGAFYEKDGIKTKIHVNDRNDNLRCLVSRFHPNETEFALIDKYKNKISKVIDVGSSLKACLIAKGEAEISYRMSPNTKEWDTAATQLIIEEAGGVFLEPDKKIILYNRKDVYNRKGYIICNKITNFLI